MNQNLEMKMVCGFYVVGMLNSVSFVPEAVSLTKNVRVMCAAAEFKLTKVVSNSREALLSVQETDRT